MFTRPNHGRGVFHSQIFLTKAFDLVSWTFLMEVLEKLVFERIWRDMVSGLLSTSFAQVLLNGVPGQSIIHRRGLRQGDVLSPMLSFWLWMC
jgi:hypothetical protein